MSGMNVIICCLREAYSRFWEGCSSIQKMHAEWVSRRGVLLHGCRLAIPQWHAHVDGSLSVSSLFHVHIVEELTLTTAHHKGIALSDTCWSNMATPIQADASVNFGDSRSFGD